MLVSFPFGRAPLMILLSAVASGAALWVTKQGRPPAPDLVLVTASPTHLSAYQQLLPSFERQHKVRVEVQLVNWQALKGRLRNALLAGQQVGDLVELQAGALGTFTSGPIDEVGFLDLSSRIREAGLEAQLLPERLALWTVQGRRLALPHDVHPVLLAYRRDLVQAAGIDVDAITTWEDFLSLAPKLMKDLDGDGLNDRYLIDFSNPATDLRRLLAQRDADIVGPDRRLRLDNFVVADTIAWYVQQTRGNTRTARAAGWGQTYSKSLLEGLAVFYPMADWRTKMLEGDVPSLRGRMGLMPLPSWGPKGRRTSSEGGTGLAIARTSRHPDLAWKLAQHLYFNEPEAGARFASTHILPPTPKSWTAPEVLATNPYFSNQALGSLLAELARQTPTLTTSPYESLAEAKLDEIYRRAAAHYEAVGEAGLLDVIKAELERVAHRLELVAGRNQLASVQDVL